MAISLMLARLNKLFSVKADRFLLKTVDNKGSWKLHCEGFNAADYAMLAVQCQDNANKLLNAYYKDHVNVDL